MTCKFVYMPRFDRAVKKLKKRYPKIALDLEDSLTEIVDNPQIGAVIPNDYSIRKLRVASRDMQRGKSGGFRMLYWLSNQGENSWIVYILFVYAKNERDDVESSELEDLISDLRPESNQSDEQE